MSTILQAMQLEQDTIVAVSTPPGRGGIGVVRLSGPRARAIAEGMLQLVRPLEAGRARRAQLLEARSNGEGGEAQPRVLDEAVATFFAAPHSYTTEDVVEIATHGSPVIVDAAVRMAVAAGARLAEPGEFTERAFLAGRLDLTQAEAVHDLIAAQTLGQARLAAAQLGGSLAQAVAPAKQALIALIAQLEAGIDFAEDDLDLLSGEAIGSAVAALRASLTELAETFAYGRVLREGFSLALVGRPNAGKSSLFNRLLERERAIVTAQPGTTRDPVAERLALDGIPVELVDTAGLREVGAEEHFEPERQGVLRSRVVLAEADLVLHVIDARELEADGLHAEDAALIEQLEGRAHLVVLNKIDLVGATGAADADSLPGADSLAGAVGTSAVTGAGIAELRAGIVTAVASTPAGADSALVTNQRQHGALCAAAEALKRAQAAVASAIPHEMLLLDLYAALEALDGLTGQTSTEDVLRLIFSTFCIGK